MLTEKCKKVNAKSGIMDNPAGNAVEKLYCDGYSNAIEVMGGALLAYEVMHKENGTMADFISIMNNMLRSAIRWSWHETLPDAMRTFCRLSFIDDKLVEVALGCKFNNMDFAPLLKSIKPF